MLRRLGYVTNGRVVAEDREADVAIIRPDGLPKAARWFTFEKKDLDTKNTDVYGDMMPGEEVHIFGHPQDRELNWEWDAGHFRGYDERELFLEARPWKGNSGGPVTNRNGALIGLTKSIDDVTKSWAVSVEPIATLAGELKEWRIFTIINDTESVVSYKIKWPEDDIWTENSLEPGESYPHKLIFNLKSQIVPKIQYTPTQQNPQELVNTDTAEHVLNTKSQFFVSDVNDRIKPELDGYNHRFVFNPQSKKIELHAPKQIVWIANDTTARLSYTIKWSAGRLAEENYILEPGKVQPHWNTKKFNRIISRLS